MRKVITIAIFLLCLAGAAWGQYIWTGDAFNDDWTNGGNWDGAMGYPNSADDTATFPMGETCTPFNIPAVTFTTISVTGANVTLGGNLSAAALNITDGTIVANNTLTVTGAASKTGAGAATIRGTASFGSLSVTGGTLTLGGDADSTITVSGAVTNSATIALTSTAASADTAVTVNGGVTNDGTLTMAAANATSTTTLNLAAGTILDNNSVFQITDDTGALTLQGAAVSATYTGNGITASVVPTVTLGNLVYNPDGTTPVSLVSGMVVNLNGPVTITDGIDTAAGSTINVGTYVLTLGADSSSAGTVTVGAAGSIAAAAYDFTNTGTLTFTGGGSTLACTDFTSSGTVNNTGTSTITVSGNVSVSGTFAAPTTNSTIVMTTATSADLTAAGMTLGHVTVNSAGTVNLASNLTLGGNLTLTAGTFAAAGNAVSVAGNFARTGGAFTSAGTLTFSGTAAQAFNPEGSTFGSLTVNNTGPADVSLSADIALDGDLTLTSGTLAAGTNTVSLTGDFARTGGAFTSTGTLDFNGTVAQAFNPEGSTFGSLTVNNTGPATVTAGADIALGGNLTLTSGTLAVGTQTLNLSGDLTQTGGLLAFTTGTLGLTGTADQSLDFSTTTLTNAALSVTKTGGTATAAGDINCFSYTQSGAGGTFAVGTDDFVTGDMTVSAGSFTQTGVNVGANTAANLTVSGGSCVWDANAQGGTLTITGNCSQSGTGILTFNLKDITWGSGGMPTGSFDVYDLIIPTGVTLTPLGSSTITVRRSILIYGTGVYNPANNPTLVWGGADSVTGGVYDTENLSVNMGTVTVSGAFTKTLQTDLTAGDLTIVDTILATNNQALDVSGDLDVQGTGTLNGGGAVDVSGDATLTGTVNGIASLEIAGAAAISTAGITTSGTQTYTGNVTLGAGTTLAGTTVTFNGTVAGGTNPLSITGNAVFGNEAADTVTGVTTLSVSGTSTINTTTVTTTGAQSYTGAVTLGANAILSGTTVNAGFTADGGGTYDLTLTMSGAVTLVLDNLTNLSDFTKNGGGGATISGALTTGAAQTWANALTLGGDTTLAGTLVRFNGAVAGGTNALTITGNAVFGNEATDTVTGVTTLSVSGTSTINTTAITTTGAHTYTGAVTLGADTVLSGSTVNAGFTADGGGIYDLTLTMSGGITLALDNITNVVDFTKNGGGSATVSETLTTVAAQTWANALLLGGDTTLAGTLMRFNGTIAGGTNSLTITGNAAFGNEAADTVTGLSNLSVSGTSAINTSTITTSGAQTYTDAVTLGANSTLTSSAGDITFNSTVGETGTWTLTLQDAASTGDIYLNGTVTLNGLAFGSGTAACDVYMTGTGSVIGTFVEFVNQGALALGQTGGTITFNGGLETTGNATNPTPVTILGNIVTSADAITLGAVALGADTILDTGGAGAGTVTIGTVTGANRLEIRGVLSASATITASYLRIITTGAVGTAGTPISSIVGFLEIQAGGLINVSNNGSVQLGFDAAGDLWGTDVTGISTTGGNITLSATDFALDEAVSGVGMLTMQPFAAAATVSIGAAGGAFSLDDTDISRLTDGFTQITLGRGDSSTVAVTSAFFTDSITILGGDDITINGLSTSAADAAITVTGSGAATTDIAVTDTVAAGAGDITMSTGGSVSLGALVSSSGTVSIAATAGSITDTLAGETANFTANLAILSAATGIGTSTTDEDIDTTITTLRAAVTGAGGIYIGEMTGFILGNADSGVTAASGDIEITAAGDVTTGTVYAISASGAITIEGTSVELSQDVISSGSGLLALGATGGAVTRTAGTITSTAGVLSVNATTNIGANGAALQTNVATLRAAALNGGVYVAEANDLALGDGVGAVSATNGDVVISAAGNVDTGNTITTITSGSILLTTTAAGTMVLDQSVTAATGITLTNAGLLTLAAPAAAGAGGFTQNGAGAVTLGSDVTSTGAPNSFLRAVTLSADDIDLSGTTTTFLATVAGGGHDLGITGNAVFGDAAGDTVTGLTSLNVSGSTIINTNTVSTTTGGQDYAGAVTLGADVTFTGDASTLIRFQSTLDGGAAPGFSAAIAAADARFDGVVGGLVGGTTNVLTALTVGGTSAINTNTVTTTTGDQTYTGGVTLGADVVFTGNAGTLVRFSATLGGGAGGHSVEINDANVGFNGVVGGAGNVVTTMLVDGTSAVNTASITTSSTQTYTGAVTIETGTTLTSAGNIQFGDTVNGTFDLALNPGAGGTVTVTGNAGLINALGALTITNSNGAAFNEALRAASLTVIDTQAARTISIAGNLTLTTGNFDTGGTANAYHVSLTGTTNTVAGSATFSNAGNLSLGDADTDTFTFTGGITATATGTNTFRGTVSTGGGAGQDMTFDTFSLGGVTTLDAGAAGETTLTAAATINVTNLSGNADPDLTLTAALVTAAGTTFSVAADSTLDLGSSGFAIGTLSNLGTLMLTGQQATHAFTTCVTTAGVTQYYGTGGSVFSAGMGSDGYMYSYLRIDGTGTFSLDGNISVRNELNIAGGVLDVTAADNFGITIYGNWVNSVGSAGFLSQAGTVTFARPSGTVNIYGDNTWFIFHCTIPGLTILFENESIQTIAAGGVFRIIGLAGDYIELNRITDAGDPATSPPNNPGDDPLFWFFVLTPGASLDMRYVDVWYSNARAYPINVPPDVNAWYMEETPYRYDFKWLIRLFALYSFTEDTDYNGKIDRLRITTETAVGSGFPAADFSDFEIEVEGYEVDTSSGYNGYERPNDGSLTTIYAYLLEKPYLDTDAIPRWRVAQNTTLLDTATNSKRFGTLETGATDYMTPGDTAWPVVGYALAIPGYAQAFVHISEDVVTAGGAAPAAGDFGFAGGLVAVTEDGNGVREALGTIAAQTPGSIAGAASPLNLTATLRDQGAPPVWDPAYDGLASSPPDPSYPPATGYTAAPNSYALSSTRPSFEIQRGGAEPATHRVSDLLISVEPSTTAGAWSNANPDSFFVWPVWAKDEVYFPTSGTGYTSYEDLTADEAANLTVGFIRGFDGTRWLRDQDITLQAEDNLGLGSAPTLIYKSDVSAEYLSGVPGIWLPTYSETDFSGLAAQPFGGFSTAAGTGATPLWDYDFADTDPEIYDEAVLDFYFRLPGYPADLYAGRLDMETDAAAIPVDWYRRVRPFSFEIHNVVTQRGEVSILNNVIDPTAGETARLHYSVSKAGPVTITVFTLDGDIVRSLHRGTQAVGDYTASWDGRNGAGDAVARGMYFIRIVAPGIDEIRKVMVVRY